MITLLCDSLDNNEMFDHLVVKNIDDSILHLFYAPQDGWRIDLIRDRLTQVGSQQVRDGVNVFLGRRLIGTTEV